MNEQEILKKLNEKENFQLTFKVIQITDDLLLNEVSKLFDNVEIITSIDKSYDKLLKAYLRKDKYLLINENISFLLPIIIVLTNDYLSLIKPMTPIYCKINDNKKFQNVKTRCNQMQLNQPIRLKNNEEIISLIKEVVYENNWLFM